MTARYLTPEGKQHEVSQWEHLVRLPRPSGDNGGKGFPDPEMLFWCDALNAIPGVCTLQSCAGHSNPADGASWYPAHLWLWLSADMSVAFDAHAFVLSERSDLIDQVVRLYSRWGQEVVAITFAGSERKKLDESMALIVSFLHSLQQRAAS